MNIHICLIVHLRLTPDKPGDLTRLGIRSQSPEPMPKVNEQNLISQIMKSEEPSQPDPPNEKELLSQLMKYLEHNVSQNELHSNQSNQLDVLKSHIVKFMGSSFHSQRERVIIQSFGKNLTDKISAGRYFMGRWVLNI